MGSGKVFKNEHDPWHQPGKLVHVSQIVNIKILDNDFLEKK